MHGLSGSGKTYISGQLAPELNAIRLRSDVERKRLNALSADSDARAALGAGIYSQQMTELTYGHLANLAKKLLSYGFVVIIDATFLKQDQRARFSDLTQHWLILDITADEANLKNNILQRSQQADASDADLDVLAYQLDNRESLRPDEPVVGMSWDADLPLLEIRQRLNLTSPTPA
jgi:predicted kinase